MPPEKWQTVALRYAELHEDESLLERARVYEALNLCFSAARLTRALDTTAEPPRLSTIRFDRDALRARRQLYLNRAGAALNAYT